MRALQRLSEPAGGVEKRVFYELVPAHYGWFCYFKCTKTGSSLRLSEGSDTTGASVHFESTVVSRLAVNWSSVKFTIVTLSHVTIPSQHCVLLRCFC